MFSSKEDKCSADDARTARHPPSRR